MKKLKGNKRKGLLKEVSYNIRGAGTKEATREEIDLGLTSSEPPKRPLAAAAAAAAMRVESPADKVAKELKISKIKALNMIIALEKKGMSRQEAVEEIIENHIESIKAQASYQKFANAPGERESHPDFKQLELENYPSILSFEEQMANQGLRAFALYGGVVLRNFLDNQQDLKKSEKIIDDLISKRNTLKVQGVKLRSGKYIFPNNPEIEPEFINLEKEISEKTKAFSKEVSEKLQPEIRKLLRIKNGNQAAIEDFYNQVKDSKQKEGTNLMVNVLLELQDTGKIKKEKVDELVKHLKEKRLLERKKHIKLAKILF